MNHLLRIPHRVAHAQCIVNGIRDLIHWCSDRDWSNEFVYGLGQGSGFAYIRVKQAKPPRQVYWGAATPRQHEYLAELLGANYTVIENRTFGFTWDKACKAIKAGTPPVLGPLDMFFLPYYEHIYRKRHIPIHYVLLVGNDNQNAYVHDTDKESVQTIPLDELELSWNVNVPAMGKKNRLVIFDIPKELAPNKVLIRESIADKCQTMLHPPVNMLGIPGMKKLAHEIVRWHVEIGEERTAACLQQVHEYLNTPPDITGNHLTAARDLYIAFLQEAGQMAGLDFTTPIANLQESMRIIPLIAHAIQQGNLEETSDYIRQVAEVEAKAYTELNEVVV
jgi:hypothetical protein